ncbi:MAG: 16S rRNA (guanine(966)-N(2))-methyltransferase RsmD [Magnetovibrio sp.]|nr:16S rRNA (guanine(966)-N(2))-methyltransferase RsmD [Magnetovibrio sp.]
MRIVGGKHKGRTLGAPKGRDTRPTSDRVREAMFNILQHGIDGPGLDGAHVIDVFAGTGALGLEALSRGAAHATFVEYHRDALTSLNDNIATLKEAAHTTVLACKTAALQAPKNRAVDYAFLDAPYNMGLSEPALDILIAQGWLTPGCVVLVEVAALESFCTPQGLSIVKEKSYGAARAVFLIYGP